TTFSDLGIESEILEALEALSFVHPTEIQERAIPAMLANDKDVVGIAQTGTGKTAAFSLPIIQMLDKDNNAPQALILSPTRELCIQICRDIKSYTKKKKGVTTLAVYGGSDIRSQIKSLQKGVHIVVGTPGRTLDLIQRRRLDLSEVQWDLSQNQRDQVMHRFRSGQIKLLVATDVAARGIDVSDLTHVINFNLPDSLETYVHRSGRTGRANKSGDSLILVGDKEAYRIRHLERQIDAKIERGTIPSEAEVSKRRIFAEVARIEETVVADPSDLGPILEEVKAKLSWMTKDDLIERWISSEFASTLRNIAKGEDLNVEVRENRGRRDSRRDSRKGGFSRDSKGPFTRVSVNLGHNDRVLPKELISLINQNTRGKSINLGRIDIDRSSSYVDVDASQVKDLLRAFKDVKYKGNKVLLQAAKSGKKPHYKKYKKR
ncbi:UNVERIFIED_CONTAM: hypothetical protein GTU68_025546, partial [Idotea baltica]|nr:hypothetical protein [Idotea baltica]